MESLVLNGCLFTYGVGSGCVCVCLINKALLFILESAVMDKLVFGLGCPAYVVWGAPMELEAFLWSLD